MEVYYKLGDVFAEKDSVAPIARISKYGFLGSLSVSIEGQENLQLRRGFFGMYIFGMDGKLGKVLRMMNVTFRGETYLVKIAELARAVRGDAQNVAIIGRNGEVGNLKKSGETLILSMKDQSYLSLMLIYAGLVGMYDRTLAFKKPPFPSHFRIVSGIMYIAGFGLFIFSRPSMFGPYGLQIVLILVIALLIGGSWLRVIPPKIPMARSS